MNTTHLVAASTADSLRCLDAQEERQEVWKDIEKYEGLYQISTFGRIKRLERISNRISVNGKNYTAFFSEKIHKPISMASRYPKCVLTKEKKEYTMYTHILVAKTFIHNSDDLPEVNHKDGDKNNNNIGNLEWISHRDNMIHSRTILLNVHHGRRVSQHSLSGDFIKTWGSLKSASVFLNIDRSCISNCCYGRQKTAGGFTWKHVIL